MQSSEELRNLREKLESQLSKHESEANRVENALDALKTVETMLHGNGQASLPGTNGFANLGPKELLLAIVGSQRKYWTLAEIMREAERGGKVMNKVWRNPHSVLYVAANRLVKQGRFKMRKRNEGKTLTFKIVQ